MTTLGSQHVSLGSVGALPAPWKLASELRTPGIELPCRGSSFTREASGSRLDPNDHDRGHDEPRENGRCQPEVMREGPRSPPPLSPAAKQ
jgi:hypothetical protein